MIVALSFGLNFYGYFVFAAVWVCGYFLWASRTNARERKREARTSKPLKGKH